MRWFYCFLIPFLLCAEDNLAPLMNATFEGDPSASVGHSVNAITGRYYVAEADIVVPGAEPLILHRIFNGRNEDGWDYFPHTHMFHRICGRNRIQVHTPTGTCILFEPEDFHDRNAKTFWPDPECFEGVTNTSKGTLSARTLMQNASIYIDRDTKEYDLRLPDGGHRYYTLLNRFGTKHDKCFNLILIRETLPNGNIIHYEYNEGNRLSIVWTSSPSGECYAWAKFSYDGGRTIKTSDGQTYGYEKAERLVTYYDENRNRCSKTASFLRTITRSNGSSEIIHYGKRKDDEERLIKSRAFEDGRYRSVSYYEPNVNEVINGKTINIKSRRDARVMRVRSVNAPVARDGAEKELYGFVYKLKSKERRKGRWSAGRTIVHDAVGGIKEYLFSSDLKEKEIIHRQEDDYIYREKFTWDDNRLAQKRYFDPSGAVIHQRNFTYDEQGNVIQEIAYAPIQTNELDPLQTRITYTDSHLPQTIRHPNGIHEHYTYLNDTNLITSKITSYQGRTLKREHFDYTKDNVLAKKSIDDGINQGYSTKIISEKGMPKTLIESAYNLQTSQTEILLIKELTYNAMWQITSETTKDPQGRILKQTFATYDRAGHLLSKTNPLGETTTYEWDIFGNCLAEHHPCGTTHTHEYDRANRRIRTHIKWRDKEYTLHTGYDPKSRKIAESDIHGNWTHYAYDHLDNVSQITHPPTFDEDGLQIHAIETTTYDPFSHPTHTKDPLGRTTQITPNFHGKPLKIVHPDGHKESATYTLDGHLKTHTDCEGHNTHFEYDPLGRPTKKTYHAGLFETTTYDGFHLTSETDIHGNTTIYTYDIAGRKATATTPETHTTYRYDPLGRLIETITSAEGLPPQIHQTDYDLLDRPIEERDLYPDGTIATRTQYAYDTRGNKQRITTWQEGQERIELYDYDTFDRLIEHIDPLDRHTTITYNDHYLNTHGQTVLQKITLTPKGDSTEEIHDTRGRIVQKTTLTPTSAPIQIETFTYDLAGQCTKKTLQIVRWGETEETRQTHLTYDSRGRVTAVIEGADTPHARRTAFRYTPNGHRATLVREGNNRIHTHYDHFGRPELTYSSDKTISLTYRYTTHDTPIEIIDHVEKTTTTRTLDPYGRILTETLGNGLTLKNTYNAYGQRTTLTLPDDTTIESTYDAYHLTALTRGSYTHTYDRFDESHRPLDETTPTGPITHHYSLRGYEDERHTPHSAERLTFTAHTDTIQSRTLTLGFEHLTTAYTYDDLDQLTAENGQTYTYDNNYTRIAKDAAPYAFGPLDTILARPHVTYTYHPTGCPATKATPHETTHYHYDAYDRLAFVDKEDHIINYIYDALHRRLAKITPDETILYIYDGLNEIGSVIDGQIHDLRVLGPGRGAEIGGAVLIEYQQTPYQPLHTINGDLIGLIDLTTGALAHQRTFTAFGETADPFPLTWGFQSKRFDPETGLYFFGRRYYEPETGRFFTPDPRGFEAITNRYYYVLNNPLLLVDEYGLYTELASDLFPRRPHPQTLPYYSNGIPKIEPRKFETLGNRKQTWTQSSNSDLGRPEPGDFLRYTSVNGIRNTFDMARESAEHVSDCVGGYNIHLTHNATHGVIQDGIECALLLRGYATEPVSRLMDNWNNLLDNGPQGRYIIHFAHSQGGAVTRNALALMEEEKRNRIFVVGCATLLHTPNELCAGSWHFGSHNDVVPFLQYWFSKKDNFEPANIDFFKKHSDAPMFDHSINSPTFRNQITQTNQEILQIIRER